MLIIAGIVLLIGIGVLIFMETKILGAIFTGLGALFLIISFMNSQQASTEQMKATKSRDSAEFDRDFAKAAGNATPQETQVLNQRVESSIKAENAANQSNKEQQEKTQTARDAIESKLSAVVPGAQEKPDANQTAKIAQPIK